MQNTHFTRRLKELRTSHHYTQQDLSIRLNISRASYSNYECGKRIPPVDLLIRIANFYQISIDELVHSSDLPLASVSASILSNTVEIDEQLLLQLYRLLPAESKHGILQYLEFQVEKSVAYTSL